MNTLGKQTDEGFLPQVPNAEDLLKAIGIDGGWDDINETAAGGDLLEAQKKAKDTLAANYVKTFSTPAGQKVLEDLLDQSLRRGYKPKDGFKTIEETALYASERTGQNGFMIYVASMIVKGQSLPDPAAKKKKPAKRKKK